MSHWKEVGYGVLVWAPNAEMEVEATGRAFSRVIIEAHQSEGKTSDGALASGFCTIRTDDLTDIEDGKSDALEVSHSEVVLPAFFYNLQTK